MLWYKPCYKHSEQCYYTPPSPKAQLFFRAIFAPFFRKDGVYMKKLTLEALKKKYLFSVNTLRKAYLEEGRTLKEMRSVMGLKSPITVSKILNAYGISTNNNKRRASQTRGGKSEEKFKQYLMCEYFQKRRSVASLAEEFSVSNKTIIKYLESYGIQRRSRNEKSSCFTGGRNICSNGYVEIIVPGHPATNTKGYVYEHRVVAEKKLGRYLLPGEVVHHIDGNKTNNAPENLIVLSNEDHSKLHALLKNGFTFEDAIKKVLP